MLRRLALFTVRRPKAVLAVGVVLLGVGIVFGSTVSEKLGVAGFTDPSTEAAHADEFIDQHFGATPNLVLQVVAGVGTLDDPDVAVAADRTRRVVVAEPTAKVIASYTELLGPRPAQPRQSLRADPGPRGRDPRRGREGAAGSSEAARRSRRRRCAQAAPSAFSGDRGQGQARSQDQRSIALPVSLAVLVVVFGGLVAAFLPIAVGITSIVTTLLVLLLMTSVTEVSTHALTVATAFGLGLSIDFGLLMVSRFREERDSGKDHNAAIIATVATAGRTIIFSAATVTLAMCRLLVFPTYFLRSVGIAASAVVILSALSAIMVLPAMLALLGKRIESLRHHPAEDTAVG